MKAPGTISLIIADDHGVVRQGIVACSRTRPGYRIAGECRDGASALAMILDLAPDVAILDLSIPGLGALEVVRRAVHAGARTRIVILSLSRDESVVDEVFRSGAVGYVLKDGPADHVFDAIGTVLPGRHYLSPVLRRQESVPASDPLSALSPREHEVFALLVDGKRPRDVARLLDISPKTVDTYRASIMRKLGVDGIAGLVRLAVHRPNQ